jgi:poly(3-hydroxybutyrate) depolymerase
MLRHTLLAVLLLIAGPAAGQAPVAPVPPASVPPALAAAGVQRFIFSAWAGPALPVWYLRPASATADAPVLFVMHGVGRDADRYIGEWVALAAAHGIVIVVPEFSQASFPQAAGYNNGGLLAPDGTARPREQQAWSTLDPVFEAIVARERLSATRYTLYGHSAGAQFVHRFVLTGGAPRLGRAIAANAGSYMFPTDARPWPFGAGGLPPGLFSAERAFAQPLTLLLGTADNDPAHPSLPDQPGARAQGPHRLARGQAFYDFARQAAGPGLAWACALAPGVGHDNGRMAPFALAIVLDRAQPRPGADCAPVAPVAPAPPAR